MEPSSTDSRASRAGDPRPDGASGARAPELPLELRRRLPARDPAALEAFHDAWFDRVYGFVRRMVGEEHLAEDLTQDVFLHVHRALPTYDPERELRPWVFTIATNKVRDHWRSRRHKQTLLEVALEDDERADAASPRRAPGPTRALETRELGDTIARAVHELPEILRTTLLLRYFEGLSFEDIGRIVDRNETAVRKRYSRALEELRRALAGEVDHPAAAARRAREGGRER